MMMGVGLDWSSVMLTLHHDKVSQSKWWQVDEVVTGNLRRHELNTTSSMLLLTSNSDDGFIHVNPFLSIVSFSERVPTGVLSIFDSYGSVTVLSLVFASLAVALLRSLN